MRLDDLSPDGGANQQMYWYVNVIGNGDLTDYSTMFYGVPTLPPHQQRWRSTFIRRSSAFFCCAGKFYGLYSNPKQQQRFP